MTNMVQCPNCKKELPAANESCIYCGVRIPAGMLVPTEEPPAIANIIKRCRNGHEFNDLKLNTCPECGFPMETIPKDTFSPKETIESQTKEVPFEIPAGMTIPSAEDLIPKVGKK